MKRKALPWRTLFVALLAFGSLQWWALREAERAMQHLAEQWQAYGTLRYERLWVNLWGSGSLSGVSFQPAGLTQVMLSTPLGYRLSARKLRVHGLRFNRRGRLTQLRLSFVDLVLPMDDGYRLRGANAPPSLASMGYPSLLLQAEIRLRMGADAPLVQVLGYAEGRDSGRLDFDLAMQTQPESLRMAPDQVGLARLALTFRDAGLMARYLDRRAMELRVPRVAAPAAQIALLDRRMAVEHWHWDERSVSALRGLIREPGQGLRAVLEPPKRVRLRDLNLYPVGDWPTILGFSLRPAPGNQPPP